jgi:hypothetical protein
MDKKTMGWGAIVVGVLVALTEFMTWPGYMNYVWAILVLIWGITALK